MLEYLKNTSAVLRQNEIVRHIAVMSGATVLSRVILLLAYPVLTRLYTPSEFGLLAAFTSVIALVAVFSTLRYEFAIPLPKRDEDAASVLQLCILISLGLTLVLFVAVAIPDRSDLARAGYEALFPFRWLLPFAVLATGLYSTFTYWNMRKKRFTAIASTQLTKVTGETGLQSLAGVFSPGSAGLVIGNVFGACLGVFALVRAGRPYPPQPDWRTGLARIRKVAKKFRRFPLFNGTAGLLNEGGTRLFFIAVGIYYSHEVLGLFWLAYMLLTALTAIANTSVQRVYYAHVSEKKRNGDDNLLGYYLRATGYAALVIFPAAIAGYFLVPIVFGFVFPQNWASSVPLTGLLVAGFAVQSVTLPFITYNIVGRQEMAVVWNSIHMALQLASIPVALAIDPGPLVLAGVYSAALCLSGLSLFVINVWTLR